MAIRHEANVFNVCWGKLEHRSRTLQHVISIWGTSLARTAVLKKKAQAALKKGKVPEAGKFYELICRQDANDYESWLAFAEIRVKQGLYADAVQHFQKVIKLNPQNARAYSGLGNAFLCLRRYADAQQACQRALQINPALAEASFNLGNIFREQSGFDAAEQHYAQAVQLDPKMSLAHYYRGNMLKTQGRVDEAIESYQQAFSLNPNLIEAEWNKQRILPVIIDEVEQIAISRQHYDQGIDVIAQSLDLKSKVGKRNAMKGLLTSTNFYLQYQGCDDLALQKKYGLMLSNIMAANYPQWSKQLKPTPVSEGEKIRIGYASAFLRAHNGAVWLLGWLHNRDSEKFEIHCYHTGEKTDEKTDEFKRQCDYFNHIPGNIEKLCKKIKSDKLHILVYPELGMDPQSMLTAGLRLAPIQCVGWGHPITSGLPTMDYWISSDLMEPENGQKHYTEKLIRLPNMANCHSKAQHDRLQSQPTQKKRKDFGLSDDNVLYFCSQSLFKYLPEYDYLWPEIAKRVPQAKFIFLAISSMHVVKRFMARIEKAFSAAGLDVTDYCIMMNRQSPDDYLALNQLVDVFLDNPPWSGNNTGLAAIDAHLPIVCYPTGFMRGRHSYAILKMLGVTETIAESEQEFIEIAAKLGNDKEYRQQIVQKIAHQHERIYNDIECVKGLEAFYLQAVS